MIKTLERYISKITILATAMSALVVTSVLFIIILLGEIKNFGEGDYSITQALLYVFLRLPNELYQLSPILLLLGSIIGLSILSSHKELAVMRVSGFSIRRIMLSVLSAALLLIIFITILGEWFTPELSYKAEIHKENAQNAGQAVITASGVWFHIDNNFIHVNQLVGRELLEGVTRYQFNDQHQLEAAYYAKTLTLQNKKWLMQEVVKTSFYPDRTKNQSFPQMDWDLKFNSNLFNVGLVEPSEMSLPKLSKLAHYLKQNGLQSSEYEYEFWQRILKPFASLIMIFLGIPFVLSTLSTSTLGWRIMVGIITGFAFFILNALLSELCIVYQLPVLLAASLPLAIFAVVGILLSNRMIRY